MSPFVFVLMQAAIIAYALVGGVFLAFSDFIMRSLSLTSGSGGAEAMQVINREVFHWIFMALFLGMAAVSVLLAGYALINQSGPASILILLASLVYLLGCFGITIFLNVPMNEALAGMDLSADAAHDYWTGTYLPRWTFWNTVRCIASIVSSGLLLIGLFWMSQARMSM